MSAQTFGMILFDRSYFLQWAFSLIFTAFHFWNLPSYILFIYPRIVKALVDFLTTKWGGMYQTCFQWFYLAGKIAPFSHSKTLSHIFIHLCTRTMLNT